MSAQAHRFFAVWGGSRFLHAAAEELFATMMLTGIFCFFGWRHFTPEKEIAELEQKAASPVEKDI